MFGYLKLDGYCPEKIKKAYKKYYCYLCRNLEAHYGFWSRFILSYDVTLFLVAVSEENYLDKVERVTCFNKEAKNTFDYTHSKSIAALSLILSYYKIKDDVNDEKSLKAKLLYLFYKGKINKARKDFPLMDNILNEHYSKISQLEKEEKSVEEIGEEFALLLVENAKECFYLKDETMIKALSYVAKWVYFIDALDDLDKDIKKKRFNPFKKDADSLSNLVNEKYALISKKIELMNSELDNVEFNDSMNHQLLKRIIYYSIPDSTFNVLKW